jgi:DNA-binding NarL/FixJ family response regulator
MRVWLDVRDPARRAALIRMVRTDDSARLVGSEDEADIVIRDSRTDNLSLPSTITDELTPRELNVLRLVADGLDNRTIGAELGVTRSTVKHHLESIYAKLDVSGRTEAVTEGIRRGLIPL